MISTIFSRISATALIKIFNPQVLRLFEGAAFISKSVYAIENCINCGIIIFCIEVFDYQGAGAC